MKTFQLNNFGKVFFYLKIYCYLSINLGLTVLADHKPPIRRKPQTRNMGQMCENIFLRKNWKIFAMSCQENKQSTFTSQKLTKSQTIKRPNKLKHGQWYQWPMASNSWLCSVVFSFWIFGFGFLDKTYIWMKYFLIIMFFWVRHIFGWAIFARAMMIPSGWMTETATILLMAVLLHLRSHAYKNMR